VQGKTVKVYDEKIKQSIEQPRGAEARASTALTSFVVLWIIEDVVELMSRLIGGYKLILTILWLVGGGSGLLLGADLLADVFLLGWVLDNLVFAIEILLEEAVNGGVNGLALSQLLVHLVHTGSHRIKLSELCLSGSLSQLGLFFLLCDLRLAASTLGLDLEKIAGNALADLKEKKNYEKIKKRY
jgi:hypothetical protein